ncbi:MAG: RNA-guided endonuclease InsQ/TnpB family protein [Prochloraceae cyanobacterium]
MKYTYQYRLLPTTTQKLELNYWLRVCRYWYNSQLGDRLDWWEINRTYTDRCPLICHLPQLKERPNYYNQKKQLPVLKKDLVTVGWSQELLDFTRIPAQTLQEVSKRVDLDFNRFIKGDKNGNRSGQPRFKNTARYRSMVLERQALSLHSCSVGGKYLYLDLAKIGLIKIRSHRHLPSAAILKQAQIIKKADGWYINLRLVDESIPDFTADIIATWSNSLGMDAVLHEKDYLATSEGFKLPSLKSFRNSQDKLAQISQRRANKKRGSRSRRQLAKTEARLHQKIARARRDHAYNSATILLETGKKVFFHEQLNLKALSQRNKPKQDSLGKYLPNGQSAKTGLNKSWQDAAFGQFFSILKYKAEKAGAIVKEVAPAYSSALLSYKDEFVFTDCSMRDYWDEQLKLSIDRDINAGINIKRLGLDVFPRIKRRKGKKPVVVASTTESTLKQVLPVHQLWAARKPTLDL